MQAAPWILRRTPKPNARARLFCLPFAGGSASAWRDWGERLPDWVEVLPVELPGRGMRLGEAPIPALLPLVESMLTGLAPWMDRPYALLGHSMGALLAFEATRILRARRQPLPFLLAVSGYRAPHLADPEPELRELSDGALLDRVRGLGRSKSTRPCPSGKTSPRCGKASSRPPAPRAATTRSGCSLRAACNTRGAATSASR